MTDDLTISVVSHGQVLLMERLLTDLSEISWAGKMKLIVTLNVKGESFDSASFEALNMEVIRNSRPKGFGENHNIAFSRCTTKWFAVLNPDLRLPRDPFAELFKQGNSDPSLGAVAPMVVNSAGQLEDHVRPNLTPLSLWRRRRGVREPVNTAVVADHSNKFYWLAGMFMLFRSDAFRRIGGFDIRFFLYCEDYDVCARLYSAGYGLMVAPLACAIHDAQRDSHRSLKHLRWHVGSLLRVWVSAAFWRIIMKRRASATSKSCVS